MAPMTTTDDSGTNIHLTKVHYDHNGRLLCVETLSNTLSFCTNPGCGLMTTTPKKDLKGMKRFGHDAKCRKAAAEMLPRTLPSTVYGVCFSCDSPHLETQMKSNGECGDCWFKQREQFAAKSIQKLREISLAEWVDWSDRKSTAACFTCSLGGCGEKRTGSLAGYKGRQSPGLLPFFAHSLKCYAEQLKSKDRKGNAIARWCGDECNGHLVFSRSIAKGDDYCSLRTCPRSHGVVEVDDDEDVGLGSEGIPDCSEVTPAYEDM